MGTFSKLFVFAVLMFVSVPTTWPCESKQPLRLGTPNVQEEHVLFAPEEGRISLALRQDRSEPFALLWPLPTEQPPLVSSLSGDWLSALDKATAPRVLSCGSSAREKSLLVQREISSAKLTSTVLHTAELAVWFQANGFEDPAETLLADSKARYLAIRVEPQGTWASVSLDFQAPLHKIIWPQLAASGSEGMLSLSVYISAKHPYELSAGARQTELDRDALLQEGLMPSNAEALLANALRRLSPKSDSLTRLSAEASGDNVLTRFQGELDPAALSHDLVFSESTRLLSKALSTCETTPMAVSLPGPDRALDDVAVPVGCAVSPVASTSPLWLLPFALFALRRSRNFLIFLGILGCQSPLLATTELCQERSFCASELLHTIRCVDGKSEEVVSACALGCNESLGACEVCEAGESVCDNNILRLCGSNGQIASSERCELGCASDGSPRCQELRASHVPPVLQVQEGLADISLLGDNTKFFLNADTGELRRDDPLTGAVLRPAGVGVKEGISFTVVPQADGAPALGIFVMHSLTLGAGATLFGIVSDAPIGTAPPNALVLVSQEAASISGIIDVSGGRATVAQRAALTAGANPKALSVLATPGPGGFRGGDSGAKGAGPGGGLGTGNFGLGNVNGGLGFLSGGGGAGFGGSGGAGGESFKRLAGGAGGISYGDSTLSILQGGSGGGGGANDIHFDTPIQNLGNDNPAIRNGGDGGGGGGAFQLSVLHGTLTISAGGGIQAGGAGGRHINNDFCCHVGAGGGGAGGAILLEANIVILEDGSFLTANGGSGAGADLKRGDDCCDGTQGLPGSTARAIGGVGTAPGGNGGSGDTPNGLSGVTSNGLTFSEGARGSGSGGGGAAGRIRINAQNVANNSAILSPSLGTLSTIGSPNVR